MSARQLEVAGSAGLHARQDAPPSAPILGSGDRRTDRRGLTATGAAGAAGAAGRCRSLVGWLALGPWAVLVNDLCRVRAFRPASIDLGKHGARWRSAISAC